METTAEFVSLSRGNIELLSQTANIDAMVETGWCPIIACSEDLLIFHENGTHLSPHTGRPPCNQLCDLHKVFVPREAGLWVTHDIVFLVSQDRRSRPRGPPDSTISSFLNLSISWDPAGSAVRDPLGGYSLKRLNINTALVPPKPKAFDRTISTLTSLALCGT